MFLRLIIAYICMPTIILVASNMERFCDGEHNQVIYINIVVTRLIVVAHKGRERERERERERVLGEKRPTWNACMRRLSLVRLFELRQECRRYILLGDETPTMDEPAICGWCRCLCSCWGRASSSHWCIGRRRSVLLLDGAPSLKTWSC